MRKSALWNLPFAITSTLVLLMAAIHARGASDHELCKLDGKVTTSEGHSVEGASVRLQVRDESVVAQTVSDAAGHFSIEAPAGTEYVLRITKANFRESAQPIKLPLKMPKSLTVILNSPGQQAPKRNPHSPLQYSDNTDFTVAGVTDYTAAGGHGSDVNLRTSEALAKETHGLAASTPQPNASEKSVDREQLMRKRDQLRASLATGERADLHRSLGDVSEELNDPLTAVHEYERAAQLNPDEANYFAWAAELLAHRAIQPALEVFRKGVAAYPQSERMRAGVGAALYASGLYVEAAKQVCAASDLNPRDVTPYLFLGKMVQASPQPLPCSEERLARFLQEYPGNARANYYLALALRKRAGQADKAVAAKEEKLLQNCLDIDPKLAEAYLQLGMIHAGLGETEIAVKDYENARNADPELAEAHFRLGQLYKSLNEPEKAHVEFQDYERVEKTKDAALERERRESQQFVVVFRDQKLAR
jgi:tetratricopeptide (TPR) repeat protein